MAGAPGSSPSSLRWRLLRQALLSRSPSSSSSDLSAEDMKQISRRPVGGFNLIPCQIVEPQNHEHFGGSIHTVSVSERKDVLVEYELPLGRTAKLTLLQRQENHVHLRDFEICKQHEIDNTGVVCLWPSEEVLTYFCISYGDMFRNKRVLELGSGYGLAGLAIAACTDASEVVISDGNPNVIDYIQQNINANVGSFGGTKVRSLLLHWRQEEPFPLGSNFDFVLAADWYTSLSFAKASNNSPVALYAICFSELLSCIEMKKTKNKEETFTSRYIMIMHITFFKEFHADLAHMVKRLLETSKNSQAIFFSPNRGNTLDAFLQKVRSLTLHVKVVENYDSHVWDLHLKFMEGKNSSWSNYDKEHCYPLLITISAEPKFSCLNRTVKMACNT